MDVGLLIDRSLFVVLFCRVVFGYSGCQFIRVTLIICALVIRHNKQVKTSKINTKKYVEFSLVRPNKLEGVHLGFFFK